MFIVIILLQNILCKTISNIFSEMNQNEINFHLEIMLCMLIMYKKNENN